MMFNIEVLADNPAPILVPHGELDLSTRDQFLTVVDQLIDSGQVRLVVDLDHAVFIDSTCLNALVRVQRKTQTRGGSLTIVCTQPRFKRLFQITYLDQYFHMVTSRIEAVANWSDRSAEQFV